MGTALARLLCRQIRLLRDGVTLEFPQLSDNYTPINPRLQESPPKTNELRQKNLRQNQIKFVEIPNETHHNAKRKRHRWNETKINHWIPRSKYRRNELPNIENHVAEIGIKICEASFQEKGLGRIVLSMLIRELFLKGYTKIVLDTNMNNTRAQHVYEKLGFHRVRIHENSWKNQLGELQSSIDYELFPDKFIDFSKKRT